MAKKFNFVFVCTNNNEGVRNTTHAEGIDTPSFKCPRCGMRLVWIDKERKFGAHGKTEKDIKHELRKVEEIQ